MSNIRQPSEAKSKVANTKVRVNGRFVSSKPKTDLVHPDAPLETVRSESEENYKITEEDRARFGSDSKAFFEWALTKAATRYEAAKYAKELMRFQYPALQTQEANQEEEITTKIFRWDTGLDTNV